MIFSSPLYGPDPGTSPPVHHRTMKNPIDLHMDRLGWLTYMIKSLLGTSLPLKIEQTGERMILPGSTVVSTV